MLMRALFSFIFTNPIFSIRDYLIIVQGNKLHFPVYMTIDNKVGKDMVTNIYLKKYSLVLLSLHIHVIQEVLSA